MGVSATSFISRTNCDLTRRPVKYVTKLGIAEGEGLVRGMGWPRQARAGESSGVPVGRGMGQRGSVLLASYQVCQESG